MSNLYMKQRFFSFKDKFDVYDEYESVKYYCESELFSFQKTLHVYDVEDYLVGTIQRELFHWMPTLNIYDGQDELITTIKKEFTFFKPRYQLYNGWSVDGDFFDHNYAIYDDYGRLVATISRQWLTWADTYEISVVDDQNELLALLIVLAIDIVVAETTVNASANASVND